VNPFFFGPSGRPLFGVFTHGKGGERPPWSVLLCYPAGAEYMRAHRAFRQLNTMLNRAGANVLRFDYSCTGDSAGNSVEASVQNWLDDIDWAMDELKDTAMADSITVVGLRMGATLASLATGKRDDVDHLVLWDPVVSGTEYLDQAVGPVRPTTVVGVEGFPMTPALCREIDALDLRRPGGLPERPAVTILVSSDDETYRALVRACPAATLEIVPSSGDWSRADPFGDALIPQNIIQAIVDHLAAVHA
jgi:pimeloyl-ACP methyl ester carboxylesterase